MQKSTTVRVLSDTRDELRDLATADGVTLDEEIARLVRSERQRRMGLALSSLQPDTDDEMWLNVNLEAVRDHAGR